MYTIKLSEKWTGLCNQLFALANGIINRPAGVNTVYITGFAPNLGSTATVPVSKIIDLAETGRKLGITLKDAPGTNSRGTSFGWYTNSTAKFNMILQCITFNKNIVNLANEIFPTLLKDHTSVSAVHFRIEPDALQHWSHQNKMTVPQFAQVLYNHYRTNIKANIAPGTTIIALTFDTNHKLLTELSKDYNIVCFDSTTLLQSSIGFAGRETCAVLDLLLGEYCNNVFVGCHNFQLKRGSTFSYTLWQRMYNAKRGIFIDLDDISKEAQLLSK